MIRAKSNRTSSNRNLSSSTIKLFNSKDHLFSNSSNSNNNRSISNAKELSSNINTTNSNPLRSYPRSSFKIRRNNNYNKPKERTSHNSSRAPTCYSNNNRSSLPTEPSNTNNRIQGIWTAMPPMTRWTLSEVEARLSNFPINKATLPRKQCYNRRRFQRGPSHNQMWPKLRRISPPRTLSNQPRWVEGIQVTRLSRTNPSSQWKLRRTSSTSRKTSMKSHQDQLWINNNSNSSSNTINRDDYDISTLINFVSFTKYSSTLFFMSI